MTAPFITASQFYGALAVLTVAFWGLYSLCIGQDAYARNATFRVVTRPQWLPPAWILAVHRQALWAASHATPLALAAAATFPHVLAARLVAALTFTVYNLADSSVTHSHRDHSSMYMLWVLVACPSGKWAEAAGLACCLYYVAGSGFSKLFVGGQAWLAGDNMASILRHYAQWSIAEFGPLVRPLTTFVSTQPMLCRAITVMTITIECVLVPCAVFIPPPTRVVVAVVLVALHVGIAAMQSFLIGVAFLPNVGLYFLGFGSTVEAWTLPWCVAVVIGFAPVLHALGTGRLMPEAWPCTPYALFSWNNEQWTALLRVFATGDTRLVLMASSTQTLLGRRVVGQAPSGGDDGPIVHDAWEQVIGETLVHPPVWRIVREEWATIKALASEVQSRVSTANGTPYAVAQMQPLVAAFVRRLRGWLQQERLLIAATGEALTGAAFVRVDGDGVVRQVLCRA